MSWDGYIDSVLGAANVASTNADKAAIIGQDGSIWTTAYGGKGMQILAPEAAALGKAMKTKDFSPLQASGIMLETVKYQFLREEDGKLIQGKKKDHGAVTCAASKTAIVIAHTAEGQQAGESTKAAVSIAEYLEGMGY
ncbi:profilin-like [Symsagittifera roscoffensis]|uniref:profilin-like n=1 Tax=Symsagittifera roscoffensis TaxID=84072 RepID=UPI00307BF028